MCGQYCYDRSILRVLLFYEKNFFLMTRVISSFSRRHSLEHFKIGQRGFYFSKNIQQF